MSSWDAYITNLENGEGKCKYAAIYGKQGGKWAESTEKTIFPCNDDEVMVAVRALVNQDDSVMGTGIKMGGEKFACIRIEPQVLVCQGKEEGKKEHSLVFASTEQAVIVGFNPDSDTKTQQVRSGVEKISDYLRKAGY